MMNAIRSSAGRSTRCRWFELWAVFLCINAGLPAFGANLVTSTVNSGGGYSHSAAYALNSSVGEVTGAASAPAPAVTLWSGFIAQASGAPGVTMPTAAFILTPSIITLGGSVAFTDLSTGTITNWFWNFGDGITTNLTVTSVSHIYAGTGTDTVTLIVSGPAGSSTNTQARAVIVNDLPTVATPTITPASGTYTNSVQVTLNCSTVGATIRYTTDSSTPNSNSSIYDSAFTLSDSATVQAIGFATGDNASPIAIANYTIVRTQPTVATPTITPNGGTFTNSVAVTLACATSGATIRYTTDGSAPSSNSTAYASALTLNNSTTIRVAGFAAGMNPSSEAAASFTIIIPVPVLTIATGNILPPAMKGVAYSLTFQAINGVLPYTWSVPSTTKLPAGLKLTTTGLLSGTSIKTGTFSLPVTVKDAAAHTAQQTFSLTVVDPVPTFRPVAGMYTGLFLQSDTPTYASSGFIQIVVTRTGAFAGNLTLAGKKTAFKGQFDLTGNATNAVADVSMALHLDMGSVFIAGTVSGTGFASELLAELPGPSRARQGMYTLVLIPADATATNVPQGYGYATLTVSRTGSGSLSGTLNDGTKLTAKAPVSPSGLWPFYVSLYKNTGACIGWVSFETDTALDAVAVDWFAPASPSYVAFTTTLRLVGSQYTTGPQPVSGGWELTFTGGGLSNFVNTVTLNAAGKVIGTQPSPDALTLKVTLKTGQFTGSFKPTGGKAIPFNGLLLQLQGGGAGLFQATTGQTGNIIFGPIP